MSPWPCWYVTQAARLPVPRMFTSCSGGTVWFHFKLPDVGRVTNVSFY